MAPDANAASARGNVGVDNHDLKPPFVQSQAVSVVER